MRRTTIMLPDELHERLRREAFESGISMGELVRSRLEGNSSSRKAQRRRKNPLDSVIGIVRDGSLSQNLDEDLYDL